MRGLSFFFMARQTKKSLTSFEKRGSYEDPRDFLFGVRLNSPEKNLIASLLERAVIDLKSDDGYIQRSARLWIFRQDRDAFFTFSFQWCMRMMNWDGYVRRFRKNCREVLRLKAELGRDVIVNPTSNPGAIFKIEAYDRRAKEYKVEEEV